MREANKDTALTISVLLIILSFFNIHEYGIKEDCTIIDRLVYPFFHANPFHALINIYVYLGMVFLFGSSMLDMVIAYIICVCVPPTMLNTTTTIGLSGLVYALIGMNTFKACNPLRYTISVIIPLAFTSMLPLIAFGVHAWCYVIGVLYSIIILCVKKYKI